MNVQDIINRTNDYIGNKTDGGIGEDNRLRAINSAIEYVKRRMTLPSDEVVTPITYYQDNIFYDLPADFNEPLFLFYDDLTENKIYREWTYVPYGEIMRKSGQQYDGKRYFSVTPMNGKWQLMVFGSNLNQGSTLNTFDQIGSDVGEYCTSKLRIDNNVYEEGCGSLAFDIDPSASATKQASVIFDVNYNFKALMNASGVFKMNVFLPEDKITKFQLLLMTDANNYYLLETTTFDDGSAFATGLNDFTKKVQFAFDTNMVVVGSPDITNVTMMRMDEVMSGTFGSSIIEDFRIDNLYTVYPDAMNFVYLTSNKGTDVTGATTKTFLDSVDDIPAFSLFCPDIIDVIAFRAAVILVPQIVDNADFRKMHLNEQEHLMTVFGKSWPRKRVINSGKWGLKR